MTVAKGDAAGKPPHHWTSSAEPHAQRRKLMLQKHGDQIRPLMGTNPWTAPLVMVFVVLQTAAAAVCGFYDVPWWAVFVLSYAISAFGAGNLMAAHHEITHFLVFKRPAANRVFAVLANCPLGVPLGSLFKQYHVDHHSDMGVDGTDTGIWTGIESDWVMGTTWYSRFLFMLFFPIPFFFRPFFMCIQKQLDMSDLASWVVVPAFDVAISYCGGAWSLKPLAFLLLGTYMGVGLHPIAGHVVSEHVMMANDGQETHSCYDTLLNPLLYNFGYHVEHHDFPNIPWNRLPALRKIAPEFYDHLTSYDSWTYVLWKFIFDPSVARIGIMTKRVSRTGKGLAPSVRGAVPLLSAAAENPLLRGVTGVAIH